MAITGVSGGLAGAVPTATTLAQHDRIPVSKTILSRLSALNLNVSRVLECAGLQTGRFGTRRAILTRREFVKFFSAIREVAASADIGLRLGFAAQPHQLDVASMAALHSKNFGGALRKLARYARLFYAGYADVALKNDELIIAYHWINASERPPEIFVDYVLASILDLVRRGTGNQVTPLRVGLARPRSGEAMLKKYFGCEVLFDAPWDAIVFDEAVFARPFVTHNEELETVLVTALEEALSDSLTSRSIADDVRTILRHHMDGHRPSVEKVAEKLHMSSRTLQRRLEERGTTYQKLLDEVRRETARRLLSGTDLHAGEVAFLLGFDETNSFTRAFFAWEGATPSRWRAS